MPVKHTKDVPAQVVKTGDRTTIQVLISSQEGPNFAMRRFVIQRGGKVVALLDTKYRDLWERALPREMLYQLVIYSLSREPGSSAVILYPTLAGEAREARIDIRDPVRGAGRSTVVLRPVDMLELSRLVTLPLTGQWAVERRRFAECLCFGNAVETAA